MASDLRAETVCLTSGTEAGGWVAGPQVSTFVSSSTPPPQHPHPLLDPCRTSPPLHAAASAAPCQSDTGRLDLNK